MKTLGKFIEKAREREKVSQNELAKKAGVDRSILSRLERGTTRIRAKTLQKVLTALGINAGTPDFVEAFALMAADNVVAADIVPAGRSAVSKSIAARSKGQAEEEMELVGRFRKLSTTQKETLKLLLQTPAAIEGVSLILSSQT